MQLTASVVVCAYTEHRWKDLLAAVNSVQMQSRPADQVVVVIDHNEDLLRRAASDIEGAQVVANTGPAGLSGARNTGIALATSDVVAFLDDDATAEADWLDRLLAPFEDPHVLGVGGAARPSWDADEPAWWPGEFGWVVGCSYRGQPNELAPVRNLMGCNMALRRSVLDAVGGFDTRLGRSATDAAGCEETELCIRAGQCFPDGVILHEPRAVVHHRVPSSRASWSYFRSRCWQEGASKARVARTVGASRGLSSERAYLTRTLPTGVLGYLARAARGDLAAAAQAATVVAGVGLTSAGFLSTRLTIGSMPPTIPSVPKVLPLLVDVTDVSGTLPGAEVLAEYRSAQCLLTRAGDPIAKIRVDAGDGASLTPDLFLREVPRELAADARPAAVTLATSSDPVPSDPVPSDAVPSGPLPSVTVVIATHDRPDRLAECLASVLSGDLLPEEVIVVDNAPSDRRTADLVAELAAGEARLRYVREPRAGLATAHNAALPHLRTELVAFTDDDVLVDHRWLSRIVAAFADPETACVTGLIAPRELETLPQQWVEGNVLYDKGLQRRVFDAGAHRPADPLFPYSSGAFGSGANMAFRTGYLHERGGFDAALGAGTVALGGDDLAAFYDVVSSGHRLVYEPAAVVLHQHHRDYPSLRRQAYGYGAGLGAHLTRCLLHDPQMLLVLLRHGPFARRRAAQILRPPTVTGLPPYPDDLRRQQRRGLVAGPWRYLQSRRVHHRSRRQGVS